VEYLEIGEYKKWAEYFIRNDSPLAIYHVLLYAGPVEKRKTDVRAVLAPGEEAYFKTGSSEFMAFAKFVDSAGVAWKRDASGSLTEIKNNDGMPWPMD
jgi:hypothetical protein